MNRLHLHTLFLLAFCCSLLSASVQAQDRPVRFGFFVTPEATPLLFGTFASELKNTYAGGIGGIGGDFQVSVALGKRFSLQMGLGYSFRRKHFEDQYTYDRYDYHGNPDPYNGEIVDVDLDLSLDQIHAPVLFRFHFSSFQKGFYVGLGPELQFFRLREFTVINTHRGTVLDEDHFDQAGLGPLGFLKLAAGYQFSLSHGIALNAEPFAKFGPVTPAIFDGEFQWLSTGIHLGVSF